MTGGAAGFSCSMLCPPRELGCVDHAVENLVVISAAAQIARDAMRELLTRGIRVGLEIADGGHHKARHAEGALEALALDDGLLHRVECAIGLGKAFYAHDLLASHAMREHRARIVRHIVYKHGARAAFGAIASELGAGEPQLVAQRSEEHTSELQSLAYLVCRLLL